MKSVTRVRAILLVSVFLFASFIAWYILRSRFRSFPAHVVVWVRHDGFPEEGQPPEYALYLRGAKPAEIQFAGDKLNHRYVGACTCYQMYGVGDLLWHSNTIHIGDGSVKINGQVLTLGRIHDFVIEQDGHAVQGFIRTAD